jgi:hypothetical protein
VSAVCLALTATTLATGQLAATSTDGSERLVKTAPATRQWHAAQQATAAAQAYWSESASYNASESAEAALSQSAYTVTLVYADMEGRMSSRLKRLRACDRSVLLCSAVVLA